MSQIFLCWYMLLKLGMIFLGGSEDGTLGNNVSGA
jgi:hypothetical protein